VPDTRIPCYLVIGRVTRTLSGVISDGVVTFDSANLQYAKQTIILRGAGHGGVVSDSRAIAWIINLLKNDRITQRFKGDPLLLFPQPVLSPVGLSTGHEAQLSRSPKGPQKSEASELITSWRLRTARSLKRCRN
jgi:hypothetical protein